MTDLVAESERTLLATMMLRPADCLGVDVGHADFSVEAHGDIAATIVESVRESEPCDPVSISDRLAKAGHKAHATLALRIANEALVTASPASFAERIKSAARGRHAVGVARTLLETAGNDGDAAIARAVEALMDLNRSDSNHEFTAKAAIRRAWDRMVEVHNAGGALPGIPSGLSDLDQILGGYHDGDLIVIGARPAMGKSAMAFGMAKSAARNGFPVGLISGEQPADQVGARLLAAESNVTATKFRNAKFTDDEWTRVGGAVPELAALPMMIYDRSAPTLGEVVRIARRWKHQHGMRALFVDYLQRMEGEGDRKFEQVGMVVRGLKNLARDLSIPVIVLAQVSRTVEARTSKEPRMGDLSDSSEIEKEADQVLMLYRPEYYEPTAENRGLAKIIVEKNRHGPSGYCEVAFLAETMRFTDLAHRRHG